MLHSLSRQTEHWFLTARCGIRARCGLGSSSMTSKASSLIRWRPAYRVSSQRQAMASRGLWSAGA
eukprot:3121113-Prymnesium_polylepis.1